MISSSRRACILPLFAVAGVLAGVHSVAIAADVTPWDDDLQSSARLLSARARNESDGPLVRAALEIRLKPGWKTYWRYPGDSGVPPVFDFSKSDNVKSVAVLFPAPRRFADGAGGHSIGYTSDVILPLHVRPQVAGKPVTLRLHLTYGACEKLCVPAKADLELRVTGGESSQDAAVRAAEARVPKVAAVGDGGVPAVRAVQREAGPGKPRVLVDVAAAAGESPVLFAEGPTEQWALPLPEPVAGAPTGSQRFAFALDGLPPGASASGANLRLTAVAGDRAIEVAFRLD